MPDEGSLAAWNYLRDGKDEQYQNDREERGVSENAAVVMIVERIKEYTSKHDE
jgi:hypothetical protein